MSATHRPVAIVFALLGVLAVAAAGPSSFAGDPESGKGSKAEAAEAEEKKPDGDSKTYTNADLERLFGPSPDPKAESGDSTSKQGAKAAPDDDTGLPDALDAMEDAQARERMRKKLLAETEAEIAAGQDGVKRLERRILQIKNPLLPRPEASMTPDEVQQWKGLSATERIAMTQRDLDQARADLATSEAKHAKLKTRK
jgi:hypothetical protein